MSSDQSSPKTIDAYVAAFPSEVQALREQIRVIIREAAPEAQETMAWMTGCLSTVSTLMSRIAAITRFSTR